MRIVIEICVLQSQSCQWFPCKQTRLCLHSALLTKTHCVCPWGQINVLNAFPSSEFENFETCIIHIHAYKLIILFSGRTRYRSTRVCVCMKNKMLSHSWKKWGQIHRVPSNGRNQKQYKKYTSNISKTNLISYFSLFYHTVPKRYLTKKNLM